MAGCSTSSFTWVPFLLLLPLFISFHYSHPVVSMHEFNREVELFGHCVKNCPDNCSSAHVTDNMCKCFNFSVSQGEYGFSNHPIAGLKSLQLNNSCQESIEYLIIQLEEVIPSELIYTQCLHREPITSPKSLQKKLEFLKECINSYLLKTTTVGLY